MRGKKIGWLTPFFLFSLAACSLGVAAGDPPTTIPAESSPVYDELDRSLRAAEKRVSSLPTDTNHVTSFATELLAANGGRGSLLLTERARSAVTLSLDRIKDLCITCVVVNVTT